MNPAPRVANCAKYPLDFQCDKHWNQLIPTEDPKQAFCDECKQTVYLCVSLDDFEDQRYQGHCVAIPLSRPCKIHPSVPAKRKFGLGEWDRE